jgi:hypothetical protein
VGISALRGRSRDLSREYNRARDDYQPASKRHRSNCSRVARAWGLVRGVGGYASDFVIFNLRRDGDGERQDRSAMTHASSDLARSVSDRRLSPTDQLLQQQAASFSPVVGKNLEYLFRSRDRSASSDIGLVEWHRVFAHTVGFINSINFNSTRPLSDFDILRRRNVRKYTSCRCSGYSDYARSVYSLAEVKLGLSTLERRASPGRCRTTFEVAPAGNPCGLTPLDDRVAFCSCHYNERCCRMPDVSSMHYMSRAALYFFVSVICKRKGRSRHFLLSLSFLPTFSSNASS